MFIVERVSALEHIFSFQTPSRVLGRGFEKKKYLGQSCFFSLIYLDYNIEGRALYVREDLLNAFAPAT